jgi:hypothetical protein
MFKLNWKLIARIAATAVGTVVPGVVEAEQLAETLPAFHGQEKEDHVVALVKASLAAEHGITGKALGNEQDFEAATRNVVKAVVALHNVAAHKAVTPTS